MKLILAAALAVTSFTAAAQFAPQPDDSFQPAGFDRTTVSSTSCTGFWKTPSFKCTPVTVPAYFAKTANGSYAALIIVSPGAGGLDSRHSDYARNLAANGMNALVLDHWTARGMSSAEGRYQDSRAKGGDAVNYAIDVLAASSQLKAQPEWRATRLGYIGESMGGSAAINVTRPYIESIVAEQLNRVVHNIDAVVALYPACIDRSTIERFKKVPLLIVAGEKDDITPAATCERQVEWMNGRGAAAEITIVPNAHHDFDAPYRLRMAKGENTSKCGNTRIGDKFVLDSNGREYPGTPEGFKAMREDCSTRGHQSGHQGDQKLGYSIWTEFFKTNLLN